MDYKKEDYNKFMQLYTHQPWLSKKESSLEALVATCDTPEQKELIFSLLNRFYYLKEDAVHLHLEQMVKYIMSCGFEKERTQLVACTFDDEAASPCAEFPHAPGHFQAAASPTLQRKQWLQAWTDLGRWSGLLTTEE